MIILTRYVGSTIFTLFNYLLQKKLYIVCEHHLEKIERKKKKKDQCEERRKKARGAEASNPF